MTNSDQISIIVPLYNSEKYIHETVMSVINQTYTNWELIIVDDCSSDNSVNIVKELMKNDNRIKLIDNINRNSGPAKARNIGIEHASGEYISFLDADDVWLKDKLQKQIAYMKSIDSLFSCTNIQEIDNNSNLISSKKRKIYNLIFNILPNFRLNTLLITNQICTSTVMLKRSILNEQLFDEDRKLVEDYHLWLRLFFSKKIEKVDRLKARYTLYRIHESNDSIDPDKQKLRAKYSRSKAILEYHNKIPRWMSYLTKAF